MAAARTNFPRGQVTREQKICLQRLREFLIDELVCENVVSHLFSSCIIDAEDKQNILGDPGSSKTKRAKNEVLLDVIAMRTPEGFDSFLRALEATGHKPAYKKVRDTLARIKTEDVTDDSRLGGSSQLTPEAKTVARDLVNFIGNDKDSELMAILARLAMTPTTGTASEESTQHLENLTQHFKSVESRIGELKKEITRRDGWDKQKDDEINNLKQQLSQAQQTIQTLSHTNKTMAKQLQESKAINANLLKEIDKLQKEHNNLQKEHNNLNQRMENLENQMKNFCMVSNLQLGSNQAIRKLDNRGPGRPGERPFKPTPPDKEK